MPKVGGTTNEMKTIPRISETFDYGPTALAAARALESALNAHNLPNEQPIDVYVYWNVPNQLWQLTHKMPYIGEWYTSDGLRHG